MIQSFVDVQSSESSTSWMPQSRTVLHVQSFLQASFLRTPKRWRYFWMLALLLSCGCAQSSRTDVEGLRTAEPPLPELSAAYAEVKDAVQHRYEFVQQHPDSAAAWGGYGMVLDAHEFRDEALICYEAALARDPSQVQWAWYMANILRSRDPDKALRVLNRPIMLVPSSLPILLLRADLLQQSGQEQASDEVLDQALQIDSRQPHLLVRRARRFQEQGQSARAREILTGSTVEGAELKATALAARFQDAALLLARLESAAGRQQQAEQLQALADELPLSQSTLIDTYQSALMAVRRDPLWMGERFAGRAEAGDPIALSQLQALVNSYGHLEQNRIRLAMILSDRSQNSDALNLINTGVQNDPANVRLLMAKAVVQIRQQHWLAADVTLREVTAVSPNNDAAWADLGFVQEQLGQTTAAIASLSRSLQLDANNHAVQERLQRLIDAAGQ